MNIDFIPRRDAKKLIQQKHFLDNPCTDFISISDNNRERSEMKTLWLEHKHENSTAHFLNFKDIDDASSGFTEDKARGVLRFLEETHRKKNDLIVHCFAGISRSGAIAKFANDYFNARQDEWLSEYKGYNLYVYCQLVEQIEQRGCQ